MQAIAQTYDGYVENGLFYPKQTLTQAKGRALAVLTIIETPATTSIQDNDSLAWLDELEQMVQSDITPKLRIEDFPRMDFGRIPVIFTDDEANPS